MADRETHTADNTNPAYKHGHAGRKKFSPEYYSWAGMWARCTNSSRSTWKHYGGRGIRVCKRWADFELFLSDMGARPTGTTLDRIDNNGDYTPSNCRWADSKTQARNSEQVVWVTIGSVRRRLIEWCEIKKISINTVRCRVRKHKWTYKEAILTPVQATPFVKSKPRKVR